MNGNDLELAIMPSVAMFLDFTFLDFLKEKLEQEGMFFSSRDVAKGINTLLNKYTLPLCCLWRTSFPEIQEQFYARSVLKRGFYLPATEKFYNVNIIDWEIEYNVFVCSYYLDYLNNIAQSLVIMDMKRFFKILMDKYIPGFNPTIEMFKGDADFEPQEVESEEGNQRGYWLNVPFTLRVTIPLMTEAPFLEGIRVFLNERLVAHLDKKEEE